MLSTHISDGFGLVGKNSQVKWAVSTKEKILLQKWNEGFVNPFRTAEAASNNNHRVCLKSKPQVKCHWNLPAG